MVHVRVSCERFLMPPRPAVAAIILFWLVANGWLIYHEAIPYWRAGGPPPYNIDLTEELSNSLVSWKILRKDQEIGSATSFVERQHDRTYRLRTDLRFTDVKLALLEFTKLSTTYHVTEE